MKRRAQKDKQFEQIKQTLFDAGVSVLKAAQAQEEMFHTSLESLAEAYEANGTDDTPALNLSEDMSDVSPLIEVLKTRQREAIAAGDPQGYLEATNTLHLLEDSAEELETVRLERIARKLEAQLRIQQAQQQLKSTSQPTHTPVADGNGLDAMSLTELRALAKQRGIPGSVKMKKPDLVAALNKK
jgi:hypothetical protein